MHSQTPTYDYQQQCGSNSLASSSAAVSPSYSSASSQNGYASPPYSSDPQRGGIFSSPEAIQAVNAAKEITFRFKELSEVGTSESNASRPRSRQKRGAGSSSAHWSLEVTEQNQSPKRLRTWDYSPFPFASSEDMSTFLSDSAQVLYEYNLAFFTATAKSKERKRPHSRHFREHQSTVYPEPLIPPRERLLHCCPGNNNRSGHMSECGAAGTPRAPNSVPQQMMHASCALHNNANPMLPKQQQCVYHGLAPVQQQQQPQFFRCGAPDQGLQCPHVYSGKILKVSFWR